MARRKKVDETAELAEESVNSVTEEAVVSDNVEASTEVVAEVETVDSKEDTSIEDESAKAVAEAKEALKVAKAKEAEVITPVTEKVIDDVKGDATSQPVASKTQTTFQAVLKQRQLRSKGAYSKFQEELARRQGKMPNTKAGFNDVLQKRLARKF